jgi:pimeloyl-ACP methyl ester carboxylesterase
VTGPVRITVQGARALAIAADHWPAANRPPVVLLHGGGQTRHAWGETGRALAARGYEVIAMDLRGHGDSGWAADRDYSLDAYRDDLQAVQTYLGRPAVLMGASLGGIAAMLAAGEGDPALVSALVLVDITHRPSPEGASKIQAFMRSGRDGFVSLDEAVDAVAAYLPHRRRPRDPSGLMKNLRQRNGRLHCTGIRSSSTTRPVTGAAWTAAWTAPPRPWVRRRCWCAERSATSSRPTTWRRSAKSCRTLSSRKSLALRTWWPATKTPPSATPCSTS